MFIIGIQAEFCILPDFEFVAAGVAVFHKHIFFRSYLTILQIDTIWKLQMLHYI